jgi:hypothetical protein
MTRWFVGAACTSGLIALIVAAMPFVVSHRGEQPMRDGPGVLYDGVCCVEPLYHFLGRTLLPLSVVLFFVFGLLAIAGITDRRPNVR